MSSPLRTLLFSTVTALFFGSLLFYMSAWVRLHPEPVQVSGCGLVGTVEIIPEVNDRGQYESQQAALALLSGLGMIGGAVMMGKAADTNPPTYTP
jgi:hypothetical protein